MQNVHGQAVFIHSPPVASAALPSADAKADLKQAQAASCSSASGAIPLKRGDSL